MPKKIDNPLLPPDTVEELQRAMGRRLYWTRMEIDENRTRFAEQFGVLTNRWRMWEDGTHQADPWVMVVMCDRYGMTMEWLYRGRSETLPPELQAKLIKRHPTLLDELASRGQQAPLPPAGPSDEPPRSAPLPSQPAKGRRRKSAKKKD